MGRSSWGVLDRFVRQTSVQHVLWVLLFGGYPFVVVKRKTAILVGPLNTMSHPSSPNQLQVILSVAPMGVSFNRGPFDRS